jgi:hypothetical protein
MKTHAPIILWLLALGSLALGILGSFSIDTTWGGPVLTAAIIGFIGCLAAIPFAKQQAAATTRLDAIHRLAQESSEQSTLSDSAKRMLYREKELDLLRMVIEQDIAAARFDSAIHLVGELASHFGLLEEAEGLRSRIENARHVDVDQRITLGVRQLNQALNIGDYDGARTVATRLGRLFPDNPAVQELDERVRAFRRQHAAGLATSLDTARAEDRIDDAMRLLMELDQHVDGDEAQRLAPIAKAVIDRHREDIAERFRLAIEDQRWADAVAHGETITQRYPNSRMAHEASTMLEDLRARAT